MGSAVIKRKIRSEGENTSKRIFCKNIFIHFRAEKRSSTAPFKGKDGAERGGVLFNSASQECTHFCFSLARKTYIICSEYIDVKNDGKKVKSIGGTRFLTFSRVHPRICCQCTRSVASIKPLSIRWSTHLWWWCFPNPLYFEMILGIWEWKQSRHSTPTHTHTHARRWASERVWCWWIHQLVRSLHSRYFIPSLASLNSCVWPLSTVLKPYKCTEIKTYFTEVITFFMCKRW